MLEPALFSFEGVIGGDNDLIRVRCGLGRQFGNFEAGFLERLATARLCGLVAILILEA